MLFPFPVEVWSHILSYVDIEDLGRIKQCGDRIFMRVLAPGKPLDRVVADLNCPPQLFLGCALSLSLRSLRLVAPPRDANDTKLLTDDPSWMLALPPTLVELDFDFALAASIWVRPAPADGVHWSLVQNGLAPIFVKELLPNLLHLRLNAQWSREVSQTFLPAKSPWRICATNSPYMRFPHAQVVHKPPKAALPPPTKRVTRGEAKKMAQNPSAKIKEEEPVPVVEWIPPPPTILYTHGASPAVVPSTHWMNVAWQVAFLRNLPPTLQTFNFMGPLSADLLPHLPSSLTKLSVTQGITFPRQPGSNLPSIPLSSTMLSCAPNLQSLACLPIGSQPEDYLGESLHYLTSLDLTGPNSIDATAVIPRLPRTLLSLKFAASFTSSAAPAFESTQAWSNLVGLPHSITRLLISNLPPPIEPTTWPDSNNDATTTTTTNDGETTPNAASEHNLNAWSLLPPHLTHLGVTASTTPWSPARDCAGLGAAFKQLLRLSLHSHASIHQAVYPSLEWVPRSLTFLELTDDGLLRNESFTCWADPNLCPPKLTTLHLLQTSWSTPHLHSNSPLILPPSLTSLIIKRSLLNPSTFLTECPRSLRHIELNECCLFTQDQNKNKTVHQIPPESMPPNLETLVLPLPWYRPMFWPKTALTVSEPAITRWKALPVNKWFKNRKILRADLTFHVTLTNIDLPTTKILLSSVFFDLPQLTSLRVLAIDVSYRTFDTPPPLKRLVTLSGTPPAILFDSEELCASIMELECITRTSNEILTKLPNLTKLNTFVGDIGARYPEGLVTRDIVCFDLPPSITWLRTLQLDESFFTRKAPKSVPWNTRKNFVVPNPNPPREPVDIRLALLDVPTMSISESRLRSLAPHLTTLRVQEIVVEDFSQIAKDLRRDLLAITPVDWVQAMCPMVTTCLPHPNFKKVTSLRRPNVRGETQAAEDDETDFDDVLAPTDFGFSRPYGLLDFYTDRQIKDLDTSLAACVDLTTSSSSSSSSSSSTDAKSNSAGSNGNKIPEVSDPLFALVVDALQSLPPTLTSLKTSDWLRSTGPYLPRNLTRLDVGTVRWRFTDSPSLAVLPLPATLTTFISTWQDLELPVQFYAGLPRELRTLVLREVPSISELCASVLPPLLLVFVAPDLTLGQEIMAFPQDTLLELHVSDLIGPIHKHLPPSLTFLSVRTQLHSSYIEKINPTITIACPASSATLRLAEQIADLM